MMKMLSQFQIEMRNYFNKLQSGENFKQGSSEKI